MSFAAIMRTIDEELRSKIENKKEAQDQLVKLRRYIEGVYSRVRVTPEQLALYSLSLLMEGRDVAWILNRSDSYWKKKLGAG
jgi:hypothetical protein